MVMLPFSEWKPDIADRGAVHTQFMRNVVPQDLSYRPFPGPEQFTLAMADTCRGYFVARNTDGTVSIFAGTSTKLYLLNNTTLAWADVSLGASTYTALSSDAQWSFAQFNSVVVATQKNAVMQSYTLGSSSAFANLAGSPPQAGWIAAVGPFLVAGDLSSNPFRIQWSGLNAITTWSSGTNLSDFQDLPNNGRVRAIADMSGNVGLICQEGGFRRMVFAPGSEAVFQIDRLIDGTGTLAPYSLIVANGLAYCLSTKGFVQIDPSGGLAPIGEEKVDRTFAGSLPESAPEDIRNLAYNTGQLQMVIGAASPTRNLILWVYQSEAGGSGYFDRGLLYHTTRKRWAPVEITGEYLAQASIPGLTLEGLDAIAPGALTISGAADNGVGLIRITVTSTVTLTTGDVKTISGIVGTTEANATWTITVMSPTHIDLQGSTFSSAYVSGGIVGGDIDQLTISLDDLSSATLPGLSVINTSHQLCFFTGDNLEAELITSEQGFEGRRMNINGLRPITDAATVYGSALTRANLNAAVTEGDEATMDDDGFCAFLSEGRFARGKVRIPAAETWTYATGVEPLAEPSGAY